MGEEIFERDFAAAGLLAEGFGFLGPLFGKFARGFLILDHAEFQSGLRHAVQAQHLDRDRRRGFFQALAFLVNQGAHAPIVLAADDHFANSERAFAHQDGGRWSAGLQARFNHISFGAAVGICLQLEQIGLEQYHLD